MDQISGTTPAEAPTQDDSRSADAGTSTEQSAAPPAEAVVSEPGFGARGRMRRRARFLRRARELAYRDLGGLVFNLHRFGQRNDNLVLAKLSTLGHIDAELRALQTALRERQGVTVLREAGITACARCAAIHSSEDRFCPNCGLSMGPHADLPIAGAAAAAAGMQGAQAPATPAPASPTPATTAAPPTKPAAQSAGAGAGGPIGAPVSEPPGGETSKPVSEPATAVSDAVTVPGRSPASAAPDASPGEDEPTEIIRPPSAGR